MQVLRDEDGDTCDLGGEFESPIHVKFEGHSRELRAKAIHGKAFERPFHAHEEEAGFVILMLIGMDDIGAVVVKHPGDSGHEAFTIRAGDQ